MATRDVCETRGGPAFEARGGTCVTASRESSCGPRVRSAWGDLIEALGPHLVQTPRPTRGGGPGPLAALPARVGCASGLPLPRRSGAPASGSSPSPRRVRVGKLGVPAVAERSTTGLRWRRERLFLQPTRRPVPGRCGEVVACPVAVVHDVAAAGSCVEMACARAGSRSPHPFLASGSRRPRVPAFPAAWVYTPIESSVLVVGRPSMLWGGVRRRPRGRCRSWLKDVADLASRRTPGHPAGETPNEESS